ncbi:hypothetical protein PGT21_031572 [Puccinia graminis f. sp. tritici]|uniref:Uncharacterized protein n=1 Tax=Puccinia graminis f. sp. tritici TaxID=56615 RepID=A0A5B0PMI5_PUCGR|nr:hypothetical protein PGT21_031572 [Puccinia graminis f. sp. tritici]
MNSEMGQNISQSHALSLAAQRLASEGLYQANFRGLSLHDPKRGPLLSSSHH